MSEMPTPIDVEGFHGRHRRKAPLLVGLTKEQADALRAENARLREALAQARAAMKAAQPATLAELPLGTVMGMESVLRHALREIEAALDEEGT